MITTEEYYSRGGRRIEKLVRGCRKRNPWWYAIRLRNGPWCEDGWYWWHEYREPPMLFWTLKVAKKVAKEIREQYGRGNWEDGSKLKVEIIKLVPQE